MPRSNRKGRSPSQVSANIHEIDLVGKKSRRATGSVQDLGTTAKRAPALGNAEWWADLEYVWRNRTRDELNRLHGRGREMMRRANRARRKGRYASAVRADRAREWAQHRAQAMALRRADVIELCGTRFRTVKCECGLAELPVGCDLTQLCERCRKRLWRRWRKRITRSMDAHLRAARGIWASERRKGRGYGQLPGIYLVTFTIPHSGSIIADREALGAAWRKLTKIANAGKWWGAYALTYEVTPGTNGEGHVHAHLAAISSWIPYEDLHAAWRKCAPGACVLDVSPPSRTKGQSAADYLSKYVTKGVEPSVFTGAKAGELLVAWRGKRKITTSRNFWRPLRDREIVCPKCKTVHKSMGAPQSLRAVAPAMVLKAYAERVGWYVPRGAIQVRLL